MFNRGYPYLLITGISVLLISPQLGADRRGMQPNMPRISTPQVQKPQVPSLRPPPGLAKKFHPNQDLVKQHYYHTDRQGYYYPYGYGWGYSSPYSYYDVTPMESEIIENEYDVPGSGEIEYTFTVVHPNGKVTVHKYHP